MTSNGIIQITSNDSQPYLFSVVLDSTKKKVKIHAKNKKKSEEQYYIEYTEENLRKVGFYQSIKGFYNRLKMAIESQSPDELRAYYNLQSNALRMILEEVSKFDDDSTKWTLSLKKKKVERRTDFSSSSSITSSGSSSSIDTEAMTQKIQTVVKHFKEKMNNEKEERLKLEERIAALETICTKLTKKCIKLQNELKKEQQKNNYDENDPFGSKEQKQQSPMSTKGGGGGDKELETRFIELKTNMESVEKKWGNEMHVIHQKIDEIRPKLVRLKTRRDFASESAFIDYICNKLEQWDANKFGPILVRVLNSATGKAKHFIGYVGEPQKWNHTICKVQWFGLGKKSPEAVEWKALDVFLPLSAYYYPDCPHVLRGTLASKNNANKQQL